MNKILPEFNLINTKKQLNQVKRQIYNVEESSAFAKNIYVYRTLATELV